MANTRSKEPEDPKSLRSTGRGFGTGRGRKPKWTRAVRDEFLDELSELPNVARAARLVGLSRSRVYELRDQDSTFAEEWDDAIALALARNEEEIHRRAFVGYLRPIFQGGQLVGHERVYSDKLALAMQAAHDPRYRPNHVETDDQKPQVVFFAPEVYESCEAWERAMAKNQT